MERVVRPGSEGHFAHALYLQGLYLWNRRTGPSLRRAFGFFEQASNRDPAYARPHAAIALAYMALPIYEVVTPDGRTTSGVQLPGARPPQLLMMTGHPAGALREVRMAQLLDPASLVINSIAANIRWLSGDPHNADSTMRLVMAVESTFGLARWVNGKFLRYQGRLEEAIRLDSASLTMVGVRPAWIMHELALCHALHGNRDAARRWLDRMRGMVATLQALSDTGATPRSWNTGTPSAVGRSPAPPTRELALQRTPRSLLRALRCAPGFWLERRSFYEAGFVKEQPLG